MSDASTSNFAYIGVFVIDNSVRQGKAWEQTFTAHAKNAKVLANDNTVTI